MATPFCNDESKRGVFPDSDHGRANSRSHATARSKLPAARRSPDASTAPSKVAAEAKPTRRPPTTARVPWGTCMSRLHACCFLCMQLGARQHPRAKTHQVNIFDDLISGIIRAGTTASSASIRATSSTSTSGTSSTPNYTEPNNNSQAVRLRHHQDLHGKRLRHAPSTRQAGVEGDARSSSTSPTARHLHHHRREGRLQATDYITPAATSSPTLHRQGLHQRGLQRHLRQQSAAATSSTKMDTRPLTVLLQGDMTRHRRWY